MKTKIRRRNAINSALDASVEKGRDTVFMAEVHRGLGKYLEPGRLGKLTSRFGEIGLLVRDIDAMITLRETAVSRTFMELTDEGRLNLFEFGNATLASRHETDIALEASRQDSPYAGRAAVAGLLSPSVVMYKVNPTEQ